MGAGLPRDCLRCPSRGKPAPTIVQRPSMKKGPEGPFLYCTRRDYWPGMSLRSFTASGSSPFLRAAAVRMRMLIASTASEKAMAK